MNLKFQYNRAIEYYRKNGLFRTLKKIAIKCKNKIFISSKVKQLEKEENENYKIWIEENEPNKEELEKQANSKFEYEPKISVIVPMYNTKEKYLKELIESLINQTYSNWELCLADGSDTKKDYVETLVNKDARIKYEFLNENKGISENSNCALKLATGNYIALLDHDDILPPFSLYEIVKVINENKEVEFIYTDEDKLMEEKENRIGPHFKPDYAPDTLMSYNYICHFSILKKELMDRIGGFRKEFDGSQDYDLIFRAVENAKHIVHIPKILYHWRMNVDSVALSSDAKPYAYEAAKRVIASHLERINVKAKVEDSTILGMYKVIYEVVGNPKVSIIIPNKDHKKDLKRCIDSILEKTTYNNYEIVVVDNNSETSEIVKYYDEIKQNKNINIIKYKEKGFNYSKINNFGVKNSKGEYIVLLNNDTKIITENWIEIMLGNCQREDVGIVGAKLLYDNQTVQHAGVVLGLTGVAGHINAGLEENEPGYMARNIISQNYSAVTGAMLMISKKDYEEVGGLDEEFPVAYNDIDLCLKIREKNKVIVMNPAVEAYHFESKTRGYEETKEKRKRLEDDANRLKNKWKNVFKKEDPYFSPNFRKDVGTMRVKISNPNSETMEKKSKNNNKKIFLGIILAIFLTMLFFTYKVTITYDSSHYLWLSTLLLKNGLYNDWDVARGPIFPLFIKVCNKLFGQNVSGLLVGMFIFYIVMLITCYLIYKDTIKHEKCLGKKMKIMLISLFFIMVVINPMVIGYYHTLLTEFFAMTLAVISCYLAWKWIEVNFVESKVKYSIYTIVLAILMTIAWQLKQPYIGTVLFPIITAMMISFVRNPKLLNFVQRIITLIVCVITLIISLKGWNLFVEKQNIPINKDRTSESFFAAGIIDGITEYRALKTNDFDTVEEINKQEKILDEDKEKIINILNNQSEYKSYKVMDVNEEYYKIIYSEGEVTSTKDAIGYMLEILKTKPSVVINSYIANYLATTTIYEVETVNGRRIINDDSFNWNDTSEIGVIGYRIYSKDTSSVFPLSDEYAQYAEQYVSENEPIAPINWLLERLQKPTTIVMKMCYLLLPILTIISIVGIFRTQKRYKEKYCQIINIITILFTFSLLHILAHSLTGAIIDRYTMPAMIPTFMGVLFSIYAIINRKKYKIEK